MRGGMLSRTECSNSRCCRNMESTLKSSARKAVHLEAEFVDLRMVDSATSELTVPSERIPLRIRR